MPGSGTASRHPAYNGAAFPPPVGHQCFQGRSCRDAAARSLCHRQGQLPHLPGGAPPRNVRWRRSQGADRRRDRVDADRAARSRSDHSKPDERSSARIENCRASSGPNPVHPRVMGGTPAATRRRLPGRQCRISPLYGHFRAMADGDGPDAARSHGPMERVPDEFRSTAAMKYLYRLVKMAGPGGG